MADTLFNHILAQHGLLPWGSVLDAGTGSHSLGWIMGLQTTLWTAITGDPARKMALEKELAGKIRPQDRVISGNWTDPMLLRGEVYDVVLADYLLGAIDGFAPYFQGQLFERLRPHVGERLYAVGLSPYPDEADTPGGRIILEIARMRDACILLAGHRCYREFPMDWTVRSMEKAGFRVLDAVCMPIVYGPRFLNGQLDVCKRKLPFFRERALASAMDKAIESLRERALAAHQAEGGVHFGSDWVISAEPSTPHVLG